MASETPIFFKVKWFLGYIFAQGDPKRAECISDISRDSDLQRTQAPRRPLNRLGAPGSQQAVHFT
jgi:hypothetical protein